MTREEQGLPKMEELYWTISGEISQREALSRSEALRECAAEYRARLSQIDREREELDNLIKADGECAPLQRMMGGYEALVQWAFETGYRYGARALDGARD